MAITIIEKVRKDARLESVVLPTEIKNGVFVEVTGVNAKDFQVKNAVVPTAIDKDLVFVADPGLVYQGGEKDFVVKAGKVARAYRLEKGDIVGIEVAGIDGVVAKDKLVVPQVGKAEGKIATAVTTEAIYFKVIELYTKNGIQFAACEVVKAN